MKKAQPKSKTPRAKKKSTPKPKPVITSQDAQQAGKLYAALALAAEYIAANTDGEKQALMLQAFRFSTTLLSDLEAMHKSASVGVQEAVAILQPQEVANEQV